MPVACRGYVLVENYISTRSAHFSTVFFHTCLKLRNRQSGQAVFAWGRDFHTLFHTLWKTGFCGFVAGCRTGVGYDIFCAFCIIGLVCLLCYLVNRVGLWGVRGGWSPADLALPEPGGGLPFWLPACPFTLAYFLAPIPPTPFPSGEGGDSKFILPGATAPGTPAIGWEAALALFLENGTFSFSGKVFHSGQGIQAAQVFPMPHGYKPDSKPTAEAAKPILQNPKSQPPSNTARKPQVRAPT